VRTPTERPGICTRPGCDEPLPEQTGRGRRRLFCSPECRIGTHREGPIGVEVDHESDEAEGRPVGRVWLVRMRRGQREVVVAAGLGRPSAEYLAGQIAGLIGIRAGRQEVG